MDTLPIARLWRRSEWIEGRYLLAPEESSFRATGGSEQWWTSFEDPRSPDVLKLQEAARGAGVDVEFAGNVSERGSYGHLGLYQRTIVVRGIRRKTSGHEESEGDQP